MGKDNNKNSNIDFKTQKKQKQIPNLQTVPMKMSVKQWTVDTLTKFQVMGALR